MNHQQQKTERSYVEVRLLVIFAAGFLLLALGLPSLLRALDINGDNLDDTWEAQYGFTTGAYASTNLVGWWQLNGTNNTDQATDRSGNGINGTLNSFPSVAYGTGLFSNALYFTTNSTVSFPTTNSVLNATNQFTFSAWFKGTNAVTNPATLATWSDAATNGWSVGVGTNGVANVTFFDGATMQVVAGTTGTINMYDGGWHEVAATYSTNQVATVYVDGAGEATNTITGWTPGTVSSFTFGASTNNAFILDEARLYNRALGATEIPQLPVTYSDLNGTGLSVFQDYLEGLNPLLTTSIVTSGFLSSGLTAYYGSSNPTLNKAGGDLQTVSASTFATNALVVHVTNSGGTALVGAPITFSIPMYSDGGIALTSGGTTTTSLSLTTDSSGNATVYYQSGPDAFKTNTIQATAVSTVGSASVTFTETCGVQSGLSLWFKADAGVSTSGSNVTQWNDQTSNHNNVTPDASGHNPQLVSNAINGQPGISFDGVHQCLTRSSYTGLPTGSSDRTILIVARFDSGGWGGGLNYGSTATYQNCIAGVAQDGTAFVGNWGGGAEFGYSVLKTGYFIETAALQSGTASLYNDGSLLGSSSFTWNTATSGTIVLGADGADNVHIKQTVCEIIAYNRNLSSSERQLVESYLADKYGLYHPNATWPSAYSSTVQTQITAHQWTKAQAGAYVAFAASSAVPASGLALWLKADAGITTNGSGNVTNWADQSIYQNNATPDTSGGAPASVGSIINSKPVVRFDGSSKYLRVMDSASLRISGCSILAVVRPNASTAYESIVSKPFYNTGWSNPYASYDLGVTPQNVAYLSAANTSSSYSSVGAVHAFTPQRSLLVTSTYGGGAMQYFEDGALVSSSSVSSNPLNYSGAIAADLALGVATPYSPGTYYNGDLAEVLVYDHPLSSTDQQTAEVYLANKYGLYHPQATWWQSYSTAVQTEIQRFQWSKVQADAYVTFLGTSPPVPTAGLASWYRADNGVTTDGSGNVSTWADQTVNHNDASQATSGLRPALVSSSLAGNPVVRFSNQWLSAVDNPSLRNSGTSVVTVFRPSALSGYQSLVSKPYYSGGWTSPYATYILGVDPSANDPYFSTATTGATFNPFGSSAELQVGVATLVTGSYQSGAQKLFVNGAQASTGTVSNLPLDCTGAPETDLAIGTNSSTAPSTYCSGDLAEILIYDHALSATERAQVELYLANKYSLFYLAPVISPAGGSYSSSQTVSITTPLTSGTIHYTLDGTEPTASSPTYSGSFTLTGSALVSAAVFSSSGQQLSAIGSAQFYINDTGNTGLPTAPTSLSTTVVSSSEIDLSWSLSGQVNYYGVAVWRSSDGGSTYQLIAVLDPSATTYADTNVVAGSNYKYIVGTDNTSGESDTSASSSVTPSTATTWTVTVTTPSGTTQLP